MKNDSLRAFYCPRTDEVYVPALAQFENPAQFYSVLFHELAHSTGIPKRLHRFEADKPHAHGSEEYGYEELVAEMTAAFLCGQCGLDRTTMETSAAYLQGWLQVIKKDVRLITRAASAAQLAFDRIIGDGGC